MPAPAMTKASVDASGVKGARVNLIDPDQAERLAELLGLLADPTRARILFALGAVDQLCVGDVALAVDVSEDAASYGLKLLRTAGLLRAHKSGRTVFYRLAEGFPHELLEHCLRDLLAISSSGAPQTSNPKRASRP
jgi:DNA-binding transcriptional ArsR family regulator